MALTECMGGSAVIQGKNRFYVTSFLDAALTSEVYVANVKTVGGIEKELETVDWKTGDMPNTVKLPGTAKYPPIVLGRGFDSNHFFSNWFDTIWDLDSGTASVNCKDVFIYVLGRDGKIFRCIHLYQAWPSKYSGDDLDGMSADAWMESVELQHNGWRFETTHVGDVFSDTVAPAMAIQPLSFA